MYVHVVKKGENIYHIGRAVGVGADKIALVNGLVTEQPVPGSSLLIPTQVPTLLQTCTITAEDTLRKIANRYHVPEQLVQAANPHAHAEGLPIGRILTLPVPIACKQAIEVNMRLELQGDAEEAWTLQEANESLSSVSVANAWVEADGTISVTPQGERYIRTWERQMPAKRLLLVSPSSLEAAQRLLTVAACRRAFFSDLRMWIDQDEFAGVHLEITRLTPHLRLSYNGLIREIATRVHQKRGTVYVGVPMHHDDDPEHPRYGAFDVEWLARYADRIVWNAEESFGRADGPPTAIAPLHLIKRSLTYVLQRVPGHKLLLGLPLYGYDWPRPYEPERTARLIVYGPSDEAENGIEAPKQVHWDDRAMTPMYTYRDEVGEWREVWYEDVRSLAAKLQLVHELRLAGVSCQVLGSATPGAWHLLRDTFEIWR